METRSKAFMDNGNLCIVIPNPSNSLINHLKNLLNYEIISNLEADPIENFNPNKEQEEIENLEVIKEFRSQKISLDEFLFIVRKNKEEENRERQELKRKDTNESEENL